MYVSYYTFPVILPSGVSRLRMLFVRSTTPHMTVGFIPVHRKCYGLCSPIPIRAVMKVNSKKGAGVPVQATAGLSGEKTLDLFD